MNNPSFRTRCAAAVLTIALGMGNEVAFAVQSQGDPLPPPPQSVLNANPAPASLPDAPSTTKLAQAQQPEVVPAQPTPAPDAEQAPQTQPAPDVNIEPGTEPNPNQEQTPEVVPVDPNGNPQDDAAPAPEPDAQTPDPATPNGDQALPESDEVAPATPPQDNTQAQPIPPATQPEVNQEPAGAAAAQKGRTLGGGASKPAGVAIAPAKQKRSWSFLVKLGAIAAGAAALGTVYALTRATDPVPPGSGR